MSEIKLNSNYENSVITLPTVFTNQYMTTCPPVYALIYIYALRCLQLNEAITTQTLATQFNILETDVNNAWRHWEAQGLITLQETPTGLDISFLSPEAWGEKKESTLVVKKTAVPLKVIIPERPTYHVDELTLFKETSHEVAVLFTQAEETLGKLLTYHDMNVLFGFYDWLRLPVDVLVFLLSYCAEHHHRDLRYVEKCALDWAEREINTVEKAKAYVASFDATYRPILQAMGQTNSHATPSQKKYINKWLNEWLISSTMILEACDRAALQIGKPKFTYVDKIIAAWHKAGITTVEAAVLADEAFIKSKETAPPSRIIKPKSSRFANFAQRVNDNAAFERNERELLLRDVQG